MLDSHHTEMKDKSLSTKSLQSGGRDKQTNKNFQCRATNVMREVCTGVMRVPKGGHLALGSEELMHEPKLEKQVGAQVRSAGGEAPCSRGADVRRGTGL